MNRMNREAAKFCEECKNCEQIIKLSGDTYYVQCLHKPDVFCGLVIYCKYKKIKKEKK